MKNLVLRTLTVFTLVLTLQMNAQTKEGLFFSLNTGYNFASASQNFGSNTTSTTTSSTLRVETEDLVKSSFGKGLNFGVAIGYMFNKNIGAELGINYLIGGETTNSKLYNTSSSNTNNYTKKSANMLQFRPTIILTAGMDKVNPYAKFGLLIGSGSINITRSYTNISSSVFSGSSFSAEDTSKLEGGTAIGFQSALGLSFNVNEKIAVFGELNMVNLSYAPTKRSTISSTLNGVDQLPKQSIRQTQTEYVDSFTDTELNLSIYPEKELKQYFAFSSFGVNFGLKYSL